MSQWKNVSLAETRPAIRGRRQMISTGHYLATVAGHRIFERGGNAIDAGVAAGLALNVVLPEWTSLGGVAPVLVLDGSTRRVRSVVGLGEWPRATDASIFRERFGGRIPSGVLRCVTPAAIGAWLTTLRDFGRLDLAEVIGPAYELAEKGMPVHPELHRHLVHNQDRFSEWPGTLAAFYPDGSPPPTGALLRQPDLAATLKRLGAAAEAEDDRTAGIEAAYELFYRGELARLIAAYFEEEGGWLRYDDLRDFTVVIEDAVAKEFRGIQFFAGGPWCQGPVVLQTLSLLATTERLGEHNSADYIHLCVEAFKLAFADRNAYYGDPDWLTIPLRGLLSSEYGRSQLARIDLARCTDGLVEPGNAWAFDSASNDPQVASTPRPHLEPGTSYVCAADDDGNALSVAPSDGIQSSPVIPGLGFAVSSRGGQASVEKDHPWSIHPGKRPFLTPTPGLAMRDGAFFMSYGTPGMDMQPQALVQFILNVVDFGMDVQAAIESPRFSTRSFAHAYDPHDSEPKSLYLEGRIGGRVAQALAERGHDIRRWPDFTSEAGAICAVMADRKNSTLVGAADPRRLCYALGW